VKVLLAGGIKENSGVVDSAVLGDLVATS